MVIEHSPGDKLYIDFTGKKLSYADRETGEIFECEVYVSVLGNSSYTYVEAVGSQSQEDYVSCTNNSLQYFQGVPRVLVPDNLKSAVIKADRYEADLNPLFHKLSLHYGCEVLPTRSRKPKDKALVENHVKTIYTRIFAKLRNTTFFSLSELNKAIRKLLEEHNQMPFQGKDYSRADLYKKERTALSPLPTYPFESLKQRTATVMKNGHVQLLEDHHYYSVPYRYIGEKSTISYNSREVYIYLRGEWSYCQCCRYCRQ